MANHPSHQRGDRVVGSLQAVAAVAATLFAAFSLGNAYATVWQGHAAHDGIALAGAAIQALFFGAVAFVLGVFALGNLLPSRFSYDVLARGLLLRVVRGDLGTHRAHLERAPVPSDADVSRYHDADLLRAYRTLDADRFPERRELLRRELARRARQG